MNPGKLNRRVKLYKNGADDGYGGKVGYELHATVWAHIETVIVRDKAFEQDEIGTSNTHKATIRYRDDISDDMKLEYDNRFFKIDNITDPNEQRRFLELRIAEVKM